MKLYYMNQIHYLSRSEISDNLCSHFLIRTALCSIAKNFEVEKFLDKLTEGMELLGDIKEECIDNYTEKFIDIFIRL